MTLTVDHTNLKAHIRMTNNPCKGGSGGGMNVCLAMPRVILAKSIDIQPEFSTMDQPYCNDSKFVSEKQSLNEVVMAVLDAKRNRASVTIHDAVTAICDSKNKGYLALELNIENYSKFSAGKEIINSKSVAKLRFVPLTMTMGSLK